MRSLVLSSVVALTCGCLAERAALVPDARRVLTTPAPVVCGPMGFRRVPLQARWGEYLRVTIRSAAPLAGAARVFADGHPLPLVRWHAGPRWRPFAETSLVVEEREGTVELGSPAFPGPLASAYEAVVIDAAFPNEDPDARAALSATSPIDVTLSGLEGASCEGAVVVVEQGALVPTVPEEVWLAELERRGGAELQARREAARRAADERRQAYLVELERRAVARREARVALAARVQWCEANPGSCPELTASLLPQPLRQALRAGATIGVSLTATTAVAQAAPSEEEGLVSDPWRAGLTAAVVLDVPGCAWPRCGADVRPLPALSTPGLAPPYAPFVAACGSAEVDAASAAVVASSAVSCSSAAGAAGSSTAVAACALPGHCGVPASSCGSAASACGAGAAASPSTAPVGEGLAGASCGGGEVTASAPTAAAQVAGSGEAFLAWPSQPSSAMVLDARVAATTTGEAPFAASDEWALPPQADWSLPTFGASLQRAPATTVVTAPVVAAPSRTSQVRVEANVVPLLLDVIGLGLGLAAQAPACTTGCQPVHPAVPVEP